MPPDAFDILGLPARFDLDPGAVQRAYLARSVMIHPDRTGTGPGGSDDAEGESQAAALNRAKAVLDDPEQRGDCLLRRLGGPTRQQDRSLPPGFLPEIMDVREQIEAARQSHDPERVRHWEAWADQRRAEHVASVATLFASLNQPPTPDQLRRIRVELNVWRYTERLIEGLDDQGR